VIDAEGCKRYLDFAWMRGDVLLNLEIDHEAPKDRWHFNDERRRDLNLQIGGWHIARFVKDDILARPEHCRRMLEAWMSRWIRIGNEPFCRDARQAQVLKLAMANGGTVRFREVVRCLQVSEKTALAVLRRLVDQGVIAADGRAKQRVHFYRLRTQALHTDSPQR